MHFPEVCDMNMEDILTAQSVCIEIKKRYRWSGQLKVTTVKDNKITKIFESTERFTNENLQDQTIVVYEVPQSRSGRYMAVNLFDLETETFFGFPFLMESQRKASATLNFITSCSFSDSWPRNRKGSWARSSTIGGTDVRPSWMLTTKNWKKFLPNQKMFLSNRTKFRLTFTS